MQTSWSKQNECLRNIELKIVGQAQDLGICVWLFANLSQQSNAKAPLEN